MNCSNCGATNDPDQRFFGECGTRLAVACPACGSTNAPGNKFCGTCGTNMAGAAPTDVRTASVGPAPTPIAERRVVSVLFADLVGFTTIAEGRDAEETRELLSRYFDLARDLIGRYGGVVEKFIGDAVMASRFDPRIRPPSRSNGLGRPRLRSAGSPRPTDQCPWSSSSSC